MAWVQQDPSGNYHVSFRFGGRKFKRSLHTRKQDAADGLARRIEENLKLADEGARAYRWELRDSRAALLRLPIKFPSGSLIT
jgi:hypothetical protein